MTQPSEHLLDWLKQPARSITTKFWFTRSSGRLEIGKQIRWDWEMYGASSQVTVKAIEENKRILIEWSGYGTSTRVEWLFTPKSD
jgi:uncharacterized protein YndB with AHSA1/START domain